MLSSDQANQLVSQAYKGIGRSGFGSNVNQIDPEGYQYWTGQLTSGKLAPNQFQSAFDQSVKDYIAEKPKDALSNYVQMGNQAKFGSPNIYAQTMPWDTPYQAGAWDQAQFNPVPTSYGLNQGSPGKGKAGGTGVPFVAPTQFPITNTSGSSTNTSGSSGQTSVDTTPAASTNVATSAQPSYTSGQGAY
jgi:hypothetical protein